MKFSSGNMHSLTYQQPSDTSNLTYEIHLIEKFMTICRGTSWCLERDCGSFIPSLFLLIISTSKGSFKFYKNLSLQYN